MLRLLPFLRVVGGSRNMYWFAFGVGEIIAIVENLS